MESLIKTAALTLHGLAAGSLLFVSAVDSRTVNHMVSFDDGRKLIQQFFPIWWPNGRDLMLPLLTSTGVLNTLLAVKADNASEAVPHWISSAAMFGILGWTGIAMGKDISILRAATLEEIAPSTTSFVHRHHFRTIVAIGSFVYCIHVAISKK